MALKILDSNTIVVKNMFGSLVLVLNTLMKMALDPVTEVPSHLGPDSSGLSINEPNVALVLPNGVRSDGTQQLKDLLKRNTQFLSA